MSIRAGDVFFDIKANQKPFNSAMKTLDSTVGKISRSITRKLAAAFSVAAIVKFTKDLTKTGDEIDKMSQKLGMSAEGYQQWDYILQRCGTSMSKMGPAMKKLQTAAATNNKAFAQLGISQQELASMTPEQLFGRTVTALQGIQDTTQRTYIASQLLGRGAMELGAVLNLNSKEVEALQRKLQYLGGVMSNQAVKNCAGLKDAWTDLKMAFRGVGNVLAEYVLPIITMTINKVIIPAIVNLRKALDALFSRFEWFQNIKKKFGKDTGPSFSDTAEEVEDVSVSLDNTSGNAKKAKSEVQKLKRELAGFDKINKLQGEEGVSTDTGLSTDAGTSPIQTTTASIESSAEDAADKYANSFFKKIKQAWDKADFTGIGSGLAKGITTALNSINWQKVQQTAFKISKSIATFLNGFLGDEEMWAAIGKTLANGMNTAFGSLLTFCKNLDWKKIGKAIATGFNSWLKNFDAKTAAKAIGELLIGLFDFTISLLDNIDWVKFGEKVVEFITNIPWGKLFLKAAKAGLIGFGSIQKALLKTLAGVGKGIAKAIWNWAKKTAKKAAEKFVEGLKKSLESLIGGALAVIEKVKTKWDNLKEHLKNIGVEIKAKIPSLDDIKAKFRELIDYIKQKWDELKENLDVFGIFTKKENKSSSSSGGNWIDKLLGNEIDKSNSQSEGFLARWGLKHYANGGTVKRNSPQLAIIGDNKREGETVSPDSKLQAMANAAANGGNAETNALLRQLIQIVSSQDTNVYLDGEQIKNNIVRRLNAHTRATGQPELIY